MKTISTEKLGLIVKEKREEAKLTKEALGLKTQINRNIIAKIEDKKHIPSIPQLNALMKELKFQFEDIIEEDASTDVFVAMMGEAATEKEKEGFEKMIARMLCISKYKKLRKAYKI
ncbi:helix-turn-helix transcriptional regulator [Aneurinibacillus aneurinilyticus]|uniref:DNA-binding helix-turn-helix protein n=1 Tax=Aneurinibacillus aneurinilyticus ATCC 12856 TaxID=649747 RepID=U1WP46_ANEAE|nr:helix-turn-helix domain-containing protein [Aneurinibacillus aneurinilyticus]ERI10364.1 DNA-binding helix-turn-helix protein [Aneurinibacillus aneurinilyticus ATCC 12856]MED0709597.1 helix-turn-helix domain-containing protein [Aneurinibacillus aneurinilyticus]MED0726634.1 helix-turn-helix domain-containing protein [Aneurinibacillus aneurinilyticus]MED0730302.1 helix-turn-helix domain-containing protein [Aneurinibacillus aneurinilyticus]MED0744283.1 helix-turn-helix domain-containing protein